MKRGLLDRLDSDGVVCAEGYLFEMERRGYLTSGEFVPEVALENPEALKILHHDFQHAGSDVIEAFTYNGHREKMRVIGKEDLLEPLNRNALKIAREVAANVKEGQEPNLFAGNISNSNIWNPNDPQSQQQVRGLFEEMVGWAVDEGVDYIIGETFYFAEEAFCALDVIKQTGLPAVVTIAPMGENIMRDNWQIEDTCKELEQRGADVVGMNCFRGPATMMPYLKKIAKRSAVTWPPCLFPIERRKSCRLFSTSMTTMDVRCLRPTAGLSRRHWIPYTATATKCGNLTKKPGITTSNILAPAAGLRSSTFAKWPKPWAASRRPAGIRKI